SLTPYDAVVVLVNTPKFGGFGLWAASVSAYDEDMPEGVVHEFGHAFGLLGDEYVIEGNPCQHFEHVPDFPNISALHEDPSDVPWGSWLTAEVPLPTPLNGEYNDAVGLFSGAGGGCDDMYRPVPQCGMRSWGSPFCPVCTEQLIKRFYQMADVIGPRGIFLDGDRVIADLPTTEATLNAHWIINGEDGGDATESLSLADLEALGLDEVSLSIEVYEDTALVQAPEATLGERADAVLRFR
ncbi:MAG: hypothetical protein KC561_12640, partial [Myxococcales bacterium]|nr:hypothetical protein [Myxococcales bacterium]